MQKRWENEHKIIHSLVFFIQKSPYLSRNADKIPIFYYLCGCICFNRIYGTLVIHNFQRLSHRSAHFGAYGSYRYFVYSAHSQQRALVGVLYRFGGFFLRYVLLYAHRFGHVDSHRFHQDQSKHFANHWQPGSCWLWHLSYSQKSCRLSATAGGEEKHLHTRHHHRFFVLLLQSAHSVPHYRLIHPI